ncbi:hypothetical protein C0Q70_09988 [Pomacea canaliculata]|uniref:Glycosyltransferase family 92 protein n=2 Tax=Pomacea canaliculata TaxID=400727 RepID=A0A2T7PBB7_POMCA|nr:hypothetical protein C0Q70_09988 [Pomacea canaliculata]
MVPSCLQQKTQLHLSASSVTEGQTIIQKVGGRPSDRVLSWSGPEIPYGDPRWQRVDEDGSVFVYSAHYDDAGTVAIVRVIAVARHPLPYTHVWCRYYGCCGSGSVIANVSGTLQHLRIINRRYIVTYVDCPLDQMLGSLPYAVSVDKTSEAIGTTFLVIRYSFGDNKVNNDWHRGAANTTATRWNITRCVPALQAEFNDHKHLLEMVAVSTALGVDHFVFYVESIGPDVRKALHVLERLKLAEILPWNLHLEEEDLFYKGQFPAIQDCLYRHLHTSRYLLFGDVDEVFVPRSHPSLLSLLDHYFTKNPNCGAVLFLNTYFYLTVPPDVPPEGHPQAAEFARRHQLQFLLHTQRESWIYPPTERSKPAVDPRKVETVSVHLVKKLRHPYQQCVMEPDQGLLHHYRVAPAQPSRPTFRDPFLWRAADNIVKEMDRLLRAYNETTIS